MGVVSFSGFLFGLGDFRGGDNRGRGEGLSAEAGRVVGGREDGRGGGIPCLEGKRLVVGTKSISEYSSSESAIE